VSSAEKDLILGLTRDIVSAYIAHNTVAKESLPDLIATVHKSLCDAARVDVSAQPAEKLVPAVPIENSVTDDVIYCLEDGQPYKSLKRHIRAKYNLSPEDYREKWNLPPDYPMVAKNYAKERSKLAKKSGLGRKRNTQF